MNRLALSAWIILACLGLSYSECPQGWFGSNCQYKCRCADDKCEVFGGNCLDVVNCMLGWFGPACQYEDLVKSVILDPNLLPPFVVRDGNDHTCVDEIIQQVTVAWTRPYQFTWLRAVVKNPEFVSKLSLQFKTDESSESINCTNRQQARVDETTMDIHCNMTKKVKQVILTGEGVNYLCSLYISGGRNVALKQRTEQSSTYHEWSNSISKNAVDGNRDSDFHHSSCTATATNDYKPMWSVYFPVNLSVNRYVLYNRNSEYHRLQGFLLESYNEKSDNVFRFKDMAPTFQDVYTITSPASPVSRVIIQVASLDVLSRPNYLTLCEVEIFGDTECEPGLYGRQCEHKCACADSNDTCFVSTGGCPSGCAPGFRGESCGQVCRNGTHGPDCSNSCSQFCRMGGDNTTACDHVHGDCLSGCQRGYSGSMCYEECENGHYGQDCNATCPRLCHVSTSEQRACHHVSGSCLQGCQAGYTGPLCDQNCDRQTHGRDCKFTCPQHCGDSNSSLSVCDHISGVCTQGCQTGYKGNHCEEHCDRDRHGQACNSTCPQHCENVNTSLSVCDHVSGVCTQGCLSGYKGDRCEEHCDRGRHGQGCNSICPSHCENINTSLSVCDHVSGVCTQGCLSGYKGDHCDERCHRGRHGQGCNSTCPQHCENINASLSVCDHMSGVCTQGCLSGYKGDRCEEHCDRDRHGQGCNSICPQHCENINTSLSVCDHVSGTCTQGCLSGYKGDRCEEPKNVPARKEDSVTHSTSRTAGAVAGGIIVAVVVVVGVIILWRFKKFGTFKMWTSSRNCGPSSESTAIIMTTEMSVVDRSVQDK